ncbi:hypothetical protein [Shewanella sp. SM96]|uniref:hypothetical protein n=1 Tax=Shewanella sp. SM96 TaxID=2912813 RepID=UPI0021D8CF3E|nr:hypothetical protein [Shewanella sp. SM96]MCU8004388.1 hypothetical protein [Shewanella sp. SM96]
MKCFICNKTLVQEVSNIATQCKTHCEHIIQNSLRGKLTSEDILCGECGGNLNEKIDTDFIKFFSPINELLKGYMRRKDHGSNNHSVAILGLLFDGGISEFKVNYRDGIISPAEPSYKIDENEKKVSIFANSKIINNYEKIVRIKMKEAGLNPDDFIYLKVEKYKDSIFIPYLGGDVSDLDSVLSLGYNKIAAEFALKNGIEREDINRAIDIDGNGQGKIIYSKNIIPYFAISHFEAIHEEFRPLLESNYPSHTLILFTEKKSNGRYVLYCYIELYSTFQNYVILNHDYHSHINITYHQNVLREELVEQEVKADFVASLRQTYEKLLKVYENKDNLEPIEITVRKRIDSLTLNELNELKIELNIIEESIFNQCMRQEYFSSREHYDLSWHYKKVFFNKNNEKIESIPNFLSLAAVINSQETNERIQKYYFEKTQRLLVSIHAINQQISQIG